MSERKVCFSERFAAHLRFSSYCWILFDRKHFLRHEIIAQKTRN